MSAKDRLSEEMENLRTVRDEIKLQIHLGQSEAKERWAKLEKQWEHLEGRAHVVAEASRDSLDDIEAAAKQLAEEIRDGYRSLKKLL